MSEGNLLILVVEDNPLNRKLIRSVLELESIRVADAEDAEQGIEACRSLQPDLVLMDIQLPGMDGLEATRIIKSDKSLASIPVVALTSHAMEGDEQEAYQAGGQGCISKPIDTDSFVDTLLAFLSDQSTPSVPCTSESHQPQGMARVEKPLGTDATILVVDDDPMNVKLFTAFLEMESYGVLTALDGYSALDIAKEHTPELILLDMMLPGMNGIEVAKRLRSDPCTAQSKILFISALHNIEWMIRELGMGPDSVLKKPFKFEELINKIKISLD